jgi:hypothetical protein
MYDAPNAFAAQPTHLRGIAPKEVKSSDIYLGAIPWVVLQLILVAVLIFWPGMVTMWLDKEVVVDTEKVRIDVESFDDDPATKPGADKAGADKTGAGKPPVDKPAADAAIPKVEAPAGDDDPAKRLMEQMREDQNKAQQKP